MNSKVDRLSKEDEIKQKKLFVFLFWLSMCIEGIAVILVGDKPEWVSTTEKAIGPIVFATCIAWCVTDQKAQGQILHPGWIFGLIIMVPISFPAYLIKNRGLKIGTILSVKAIGILFVGAILSMSFGSITNYILQT